MVIETCIHAYTITHTGVYTHSMLTYLAKSFSSSGVISRPWTRRSSWLSTAPSFCFPRAALTARLCVSLDSWVYAVEQLFQSLTCPVVFSMKLSHALASVWAAGYWCTRYGINLCLWVSPLDSWFLAVRRTAPRGHQDCSCVIVYGHYVGCGESQSCWWYWLTWCEWSYESANSHVRFDPSPEWNQTDSNEPWSVCWLYELEGTGDELMAMRRWWLWLDQKGRWSWWSWWTQSIRVRQEDGGGVNRGS